MLPVLPERPAAQVVRLAQVQVQVPVPGPGLRQPEQVPAKRLQPLARQLALEMRPPLAPMPRQPSPERSRRRPRNRRRSTPMAPRR